MIVYLMCGWYRHDDGMADYYDVESTLEKAKAACLEHAQGWCDTVDDLTLNWDESNPELIMAFIDGDLLMEGDDYIYEIKRRDLGDSRQR